MYDVAQRELAPYLLGQDCGLTPAERALVHLAANPAAPEDVLLRLVGFAPALRPLAARTVGLTARLAESLYGFVEGDAQDYYVVYLLPRNTALPPELRGRLAAHSDPQLREGVADLPDLPTDPADRADWLRLLTALAADPEPQVRAAVAANRHTPPDLAEALARDSDPQVRRGLAEQPDPDRIAAAWSVLLRDPEPRVRAAAAKHRGRPRIPVDVAEQLLADPSTRLYVLANPHAPVGPHVLARLAADPDSSVRMLVAGRPDLPPELLAALAADPNGWVQAAVAVRGDIDEPLRDTLVRQVCGENGDADEENAPAVGPDGSPLIFTAWIDDAQGDSATAWMAHVPPQRALAYVHSRHAFLRRAAAARAPLPPDVLAALWDGADPEAALLAAARHPDPPGAVLERLFAQHGPAAGFYNLAAHPNFPPDAAARLARSTEPWHQAFAAARAPSLPAATVARLSADPDPWVRALAARRRDLPPDRVPALLADPEYPVPEAMGGSPALPREWMERLVEGVGGRARPR